MRFHPLALFVLLVVLCGNANANVGARNCSPNSNCGVSLAGIVSSADSKNCSFVHIDAFSATIVDMLDATEFCQLDAVLARSTINEQSFYYSSGAPNSAVTSFNIYTADVAALPAVPDDAQLIGLHGLNGQLYALTANFNLYALTIGVDVSFRLLLTVSEEGAAPVSIVSTAASLTPGSSYANADFLYVISTYATAQSTVQAVNLSSLAVSSSILPQEIASPLTAEYYLTAPTPSQPDPVPWLLFTTSTGITAWSLDSSHKVISVLTFDNKLSSAKTAYLKGTMVVASESGLNTWLLSSDLSTATPQSESPFPQFAWVFGNLPAFD